MGQTLLDTKVVSFVESSSPGFVERRVESISGGLSMLLSGYAVPGAYSFGFSWSPSLGVTCLTFPLLKPFVEYGSWAPFEHGVLLGMRDGVLWILGVPDAHAKIQKCSFYGERAVAARLVILAALLRMPEQEARHFYRNGWGSSFNVQCVGCERVYALGLG